MKANIRKSEFVERCFRERLDDGQPHSYRDILEYIREQAVGTEFEGSIEQNNAVLSFRKCIESPDSPYGRMRHGVYQKVAPSVLQDCRLCTALTELHGLLDRSLSLQKALAEIHAKCRENWPENVDSFDAVWKSTDKNLDTAIDCLSAWIADIEDLNMEPQEETEVPFMGMQM